MARYRWVFVLLMLSCAGCTPTQTLPQSARVVTEAGRVDALPGRAVVVPLIGRSWADESWFRPGTVLPARFDDGSEGVARVVRARVDPSTEEGDRAAAWWLGWPGRWSVPRQETAGVGAWLLVLDAPPPDARRVAVADRTLDLNTLAAPRRRPEVWSPTFTIDAEREPLASALRLESRSPLTRWRSRWLTRGLMTVSPAGEAPDRFEDPLIEALADLTEARVAAAIARLDSTEPVLAPRLARTLTLVVSMGDAGMVPAYPAFDRDVDQLLHDLLDPVQPDDRAVAVARAWLRAQPEALAWVADDAGVIDGLSAATLSMVGVANLSDTARPAWITSAGKPSPDMTLCPPFAVTFITVAAWSPDSNSPPTSAITLSLGRWRTQATVRGGTIPVTPPGFVAGPLVADWTLPALRAADERSLHPERERGTAALLHRVPVDADTGSPPSTAGPEHAWTLHVECRVPPDAPREGDHVTIHLGPSAAPLAVIRVGSDGSIDAGGPHAEAHARVTHLPDRWVATVRLPTGAIDADGVLRLGLTRVDSRGVRFSWPRPLLPWTNAPGRLALDTRAWDR